jgi:hypothetical protein
MPEQDPRCWNRLKYCFHGFNLFPSVPPSTNKYELGIQRTATILFVLLLILSLALPPFYILYEMRTETVGSLAILSPSLRQYSQLYAEGLSDLTCTCTQIAINHDKFIEINITMHDVCTSMFVTDMWISYLAANDETTTMRTDDFR